MVSKSVIKGAAVIMPLYLGASGNATVDCAIEEGSKPMQISEAEYSRRSTGNTQFIEESGLWRMSRYNSAARNFYSVMCLGILISKCSFYFIQIKN